MTLTPVDTTPREEPGALPSWPADAAWVVPGKHGTPSQALSRIGLICGAITDPFSAMLAVLATHQGVAKDILALSILQFRPDLADVGQDGVMALLTSILNGGRQGFDAVLRARRKSERKATDLPWARG